MLGTTISSGRANSPKLTANIADHGTIYGGRGLDFDGVTDYLTIDKLNIGTTSGTTSISVWVNPDGVSDTQNIFANTYDTNNRLAFQIKSNEAIIGKLTGTPAYASGSISANVWTHLVGVINDGVYALYINGELQTGTTATTSPASTQAGIIGARSDPATEKFNGTMSDLKIFDTNLTASQVQELYLKPEQSAPSAVQDNLIRWYPMCEGNPDSPQSIVYDHSEKKLSTVYSRDFAGVADGTDPITLSYIHAYGSPDEKTIDNERIKIRNSNNTGVYWQEDGLTSSKLYKLTIDATGDVHENGVYSSSISFTLSDGTFTAYKTGITSTGIIYLRSGANDGSASTTYYDNLKVEEVLMGNHATTVFYGDDLQDATWNNSDFDDGSELITNGTMESNANWGNATSNSPASQGQSTEQEHAGSNSWKFVTGSGTETGGIKNTTAFTTVTGRVYRLNYWIYNVGANSHNLTITEGDGTGQISGYNQKWMTGQTNGQWNEITVEYVESSGGSAGYVEFLAPSTSNTWYIDDVSLKEAGFSGASVDGFRAQNTNASVGNDDNAYGKQITFTAGKTYKIEFTCTANNAVSLPAIHFGISSNVGGNADTTQDNAGAGANDFTFTPSSTLTNYYPYIRVGSNALHDFTITNYSIKEVGVSSTGFATAQEEPTIPQVPLLRYNEKLTFDGYDDNVNLGTVPVPTDYPLTISAWIVRRTGSNPATQEAIFSANAGWQLALNTASKIRFEEKGSGTQAESTTGITDTDLHHVVVTVNTSNTVTYYLDGVTLDTDTYDQDTASGQTWYIGQHGGSGGYFNGLIDEVTVWNDDLSATEVQELFADGVALDATTHSKADNLMGYWRNDGISSWVDRAPERMLFDGSDDHIDCGSIATIAPTSNVAISLWFQAPNITAFDCFFARKVDSNNIIKVWWHGNKIVMEIHEGGTKYARLGDWTPDSDWHHLVWMWDTSGSPAESKNTLYLDNVSLTLASGSGYGNDNSITNFEIGAGNSANPFTGIIDEVAYFNNTLTSDEVTELYNLGLNGDVLTHSNQTNLISYWKNEGITNALWEDRKGSNDGTVAGSPTLIGGNNGTPAGTPESIVVREGLNSNKDGLGFPFRNDDRDVLRLSKSSQGASAPKEDFIKMYPDSPYFNPAMEMTVMCWAKNNASAPSANQTLISKYDSGIGKRGWNMMVISNKQVNVVFGDPSDGSVEATTNTTATVSGITSSGGLIDCTNWYHYCFTYSAGTFIQYVNATVIGHGSTGTVPSTLYTGGENLSYINIGTIDNGTDYFWDGLIDEVFFYDKALSPTEISKNYKHGKGKHKN